jgi:protein involved in polysaccharide export with SLBB domain
MKEIISAIISKLSDDYYDASGKTKIALVVSVAAALAVVGGVSIRSCRSSSTSSRRRDGLSSLSITGENGDRWVLDLTKGQTLSVLKSSGSKPGPPLLVKTDVQTKGREVSIGLIVEGQAGEKYAGGVKKNEQWQPPPRFKVVDKAGAVLASGKFEYG